MNDLPSADSLFEHASCGLILVEPHGLIRKVNATFCEWIGRPASELVGHKRIQELFSIGGRLFHQTHWAPLMQVQGSVAEVQLDVIHQGGHTIPMLFNAVRRKHGDVLFDEISVFVATDRKAYENELRIARHAAETSLGERLRAEQLLIEVNKQLSNNDRQKDYFIATLAHELRNPLSPIGMAASMIQHSSTEPKIARFAATIDRQIKHLARLVDDLLEVSRMTTGKINLLQKHTTLNAVLNVALDIAHPMFAEKKQRFQINRSDEDIPLFCDASRISQVIGNILVNASKYTDQDGSIFLSITATGKDLTIEVQDNGIGIDQDKLHLIFDLFNQVDARAARSGGGMGIGLALVKNLSELHNGTVDVASQVGVGSTFKITLPIISSDQKAIVER
jgi:PAS domain S-box-containing protein